MKKVVLLMVAMIFIAGTAYSAVQSASGSWLMTIPTQVKSVGTTLSTVQASTQTFSLVIDGAGNVDHVQTSQPSGQYYGTDGIYHSIMTRPANSGTYIDNGNATYTIDANATSGQFTGTSGAGSGFPTEFTIHQYVYADASTNTLSNGIVGVFVDISGVHSLPPSFMPNTMYIYFTATRMVHIPAAFWLLASGLAGLAAFRKQIWKS